MRRIAQIFAFILLAGCGADQTQRPLSSMTYQGEVPRFANGGGDSINNGDEGFRAPRRRNPEWYTIPKSLRPYYLRSPQGRIPSFDNEDWS